MTGTLTLSTVMVGEKDIKVLRSLLNLAGGRVRTPWTVSRNGDGDAALVDVDDPEGIELFEDLHQGDRLAVALSRKRDFPARYLLHKPLRVSEFIGVLEELAAAATGDRQPDGWRCMALAGADDSLPLSEHLRRHTWTGAVMLRLEGLPDLYIDAGAGVWYSNASDLQLADLLKRRVSSRHGRPLTSADLVAATEGMTQNSLTNLRWRAGLAQSRGGLHPELAGDVVFMLPQVPLQALSDTAYSRQARILLRGPMDIDTLQSVSRAAMEDVAEFLNACHACGFLLVSRAQRAVVNG